MTDQKISQLPASTVPLAGTEVLPIVQSGTTKKVPVSDLTANRAVSGLSFATANMTVGASGVTAGTDASYSVNSGATQVVEAGYTTGSFRPALKMRSVGANHDIIVQFTDLCRFYNAAGDTKFAVDHLNSKVTSDYDIALAAGKGIDFSATAGTGTSELLADYEEGNWYPTFTSGGSSFVYQGYSGTYTKIGNVVYVRGWISVQSATANGDQLKIGGLPYTAGTGGHATSISYANSALINSTSTNLPTMYLTGTTLDFYKTDGNAFNGTDVSNINGINMYFGATYTV